MKKLVVIDGNSILNRAFFAIMGSKALMTPDGTYTNAVYGFLAIMFKMLEDEKPDYLVVAFDVHAPTKRHEMYADYKGTRKGMPDELKMQMPIIKEVLEAMNIKIIEMAGYEADDILGTLSRYGEENGLTVRLLTGDRDSFQLATKDTIIMLPRTKGGKTETDIYDEDAIKETYGVEPVQMIEVKGLMGDTSDNIPGVPGVGEKTALKLIKEFENIENLYNQLDAGEAASVKGKLRENLIANKELAFLSKKLGTIDVDAPIEKDLEECKVEEWNKEKVYQLFKALRFKRFIERFQLGSLGDGPILAQEKKSDAIDSSENPKEEKNNQQLDITDISKDEQSNNPNRDNEPKKSILDSQPSKELDFTIKDVITDKELDELIEKINTSGRMNVAFEIADIVNFDIVIPKKILKVYITIDDCVYSAEFKPNWQKLKPLFEDEKVLKVGHDVKYNMILLMQYGFKPAGFGFDTKIAAYLLNSNIGKYPIADVALTYLNKDIDGYLEEKGVVLDKKGKQTSLFDEENSTADSSNDNLVFAVESYLVSQLKDVLEEKLKEIGSYELFTNIEMPMAAVLAEMQYVGVYVDEEEIYKFGEHLKRNLEELRIDIFKQAGEDFNINSTQQLGHILFEKLELPAGKKNKTGYSTDVDTLEKIKDLHPIVQKILDYRQVMKLNSTYVEGLLPFIHTKTGRIHSYFHQTITATGRLSSSDPNLQNIPTRTKLGQKLRKVFKPEKGKIFVDADYSQIELRVLAHVAKDEKMIKAFNDGIDIHTMTASQVFDVPVEEVSKQLRSRAKAVNFGIVYGISDFGLAEQIGMKRAEAKEYINKYLETYSGIDAFMKNVVEEAKEKGYVKTEYGRVRYIPELANSNYMVRQFGARAAMNTPIQGTAADIMKIAMINVAKELKKRGLKSRIVLQIHDELLIETELSEKKQVYEILNECMKNAANLSVPLEVEISEGKSWFQAK